MRTCERVAKLKELNVLLKMFDLPALAHYERGKPNSDANTWRPYPFRIDVPVRFAANSGAKPGTMREKMVTTDMFGTLSELDKRVHEMVREQQARHDEVGE